MPHSQEVQGIIRYLANRGVPFRVTSTTGDVHSPGSYHYQEGTGGNGLAVDFAEPAPSANTPGLLAIFGHFASAKSQLAELIYSGAPFSVKNGTVVPRYAIAGHWNHVHVAVPRGTFLAPTEVPVPDDPNAPNLPDIKFFVPIVNAQTGECRGYYIVASNGELHAFGPGAPMFGRSEVVA